MFSKHPHIMALASIFHECTANALKIAGVHLWNENVCQESEWDAHKHSFMETYVIKSRSLRLWFSTIAFISAVNCIGVHMNRTPDHHFYADSGTVHGCATEFGKQRSHHPNKLNSDVSQTVRTKSPSVKAP